MATTTNYGWTTPNDTDLVRDGASAIRSLGSAIDTTVFNNANAAVQKTLVDAKGDLITATAADTPARLAVGNNGETLVADSSASTGLRWQGSMAAGKNAIINGGFDIWQRGTSFTTSMAYTADRWYRGSNAAQTVTRQTTSDTTNLPFIQYCARVQRNSGSTNTDQINLGQPMETVNTIPLVGKQIVVSYYARRGSNFSGTDNLLGFTLWTGTGTDQNVFSTYTGAATPIATAITMTTTWQRFSHTITLASTVTEITPVFYYNPIGTAGANDYFEVTGVQIEVGATPTQFSRAGGTLAGELAACQRYYWRQSAKASNYSSVGNGFASSTSVVKFQVKNPTTMRTVPTSIDQSGLYAWDGVNLIGALTNVTLEFENERYLNFTANTGAGSFTANRPYGLVLTYPNAWIGCSAEL